MAIGIRATARLALGVHQTDSGAWILVGSFGKAGNLSTTGNTSWNAVANDTSEWNIATMINAARVI